MQSLNINAINTVRLSHARMDRMPFDICWIDGTDETKREMLNYRWHHHTFFEVHFVTNGYMLYGFQDREVTVQSGEILIVAPTCIHRVAGHGAEFGKLTVALEADADSGMGEVLRSMAGQPRRMTENVWEALDAALRLAEQKGRYRAELFMLAFCGVIFRIADCADSGLVALSGEGEQDERLIKAKKLIEDNTGNFYSCEEVARYCYVSVKQLGRIFRRYEGIGLREYIHRQKLEAAKRLLLASEQPLWQISADLGFSDVHYFGKFFIRMTGMSPTEFKKQGKRGFETE